MSALRAGLMLAMLAAGSAHADCQAPSGQHERLESAKNILYVQSRPAKPGVGAYFALDVTVCAKSGAAPAQLTVEATMPEHGHGMNTRATITPVGAGRWRAQGLQFHMPGRWRLVFILRGDAGSDRLQREIRLE